MEMARQHPNRVSVPELLTELQVTKTELENIKVNFLLAKYRTKLIQSVTLINSTEPRQSLITICLKQGCCWCNNCSCCIFRM